MINNDEPNDPTSNNEENEEERSFILIQNADATSNNDASSPAINANSIDEFVSSLSSVRNNAEDARRVRNHLQLRLPRRINQVQVFSPETGSVSSVSGGSGPRNHLLSRNNQHQLNSSRYNPTSVRQRSQLPIRSSRRFHQHQIGSNSFLAQRNGINNRLLGRINHVHENISQNSSTSLAPGRNMLPSRLPRRINELRRETNDPDIGLMSRVFSTNLITERSDRFRSISLGYTQTSTANISNVNNITVNTFHSTPLNPSYIPRSVRPHFNQRVLGTIQESSSNILFNEPVADLRNIYTTRPEEFNSSNIPTLAHWNDDTYPSISNSLFSPRRFTRLNDFTSREVTLPPYNESITTLASIEDPTLNSNNDFGNIPRFEQNENPSSSNIASSSIEATNNNFERSDIKEYPSYYHDSDSEECSSSAMSVEKSAEEENETVQPQFLLNDTLQEQATQNESDEASGRRFMMSMYLQNYLCTGRPGPKPSPKKSSSDQDKENTKNEKKDDDI